MTNNMKINKIYLVLLANYQKVEAKNHSKKMEMGTKVHLRKDQEGQKLILRK